MLAWKYEPWKIYISVSFTFPSVVGKPTSYSRHDLDDVVQPILERWQTEGIMILSVRAQVTSERWNSYEGKRHDLEETFLDSGMWWTNTNHNLLLETMNVDSCFNDRCWICSETNFNMLHNNEERLKSKNAWM